MYVVNIIEASLLAACLFCFLYQVRDHLFLFLNNETTTVFIIEEDKDLTFPQVAICSRQGIKVQSLVDLGLSENFWQSQALTEEDRFKAANNATELEGWWNYTTYSMETIIKEAYYHYDAQNKAVIYGDNVSPNASDFGVIEELNSYRYGKCYLITWKRKLVNEAEFIGFHLRIPKEMETISAIVFEKGLEKTGIHFEYFFGPYRIFDISPSRALTVGAFKSEKFLDPLKNDCSEDISKGHYVDCLVNKTLDGFDGCYQVFLHKWDVARRMCQNATEAKYSYNKIRYPLAQHQAEGKCRKPCRVQELSYQVRDVTNTLKPGIRDSSFYMYFDSMTMEKSRQRKLYDFSSIVAAVGGSMGLFLGFSVLDFAQRALRLVHTRIVKSKA